MLRSYFRLTQGQRLIEVLWLIYNNLVAITCLFSIYLTFFLNLQGAIYLKRYDNFHISNYGVRTDGEAAASNPNTYFPFSLSEFSSPYVNPMWPRQQIYLRRLDFLPATFSHLVSIQFNIHGFNLPYRDARALKCQYDQPHQRCVDNYRLRHL